MTIKQIDSLTSDKLTVNAYLSTWTKDNLHIFKLLAILSAFTFILEHFGKKLKFKFIRISYWLNKIYPILRPIYIFIGKLYAELMTFLSMIDLDDLLDTARVIFGSSYKVCIGLPLDSIKSMYNHANKIASFGMVILGTHIVLIIGYMYYFYREYNTYTHLVSAFIIIMIVARYYLLHRDKLSTSRTSPSMTSSSMT